MPLKQTMLTLAIVAHTVLIFAEAQTPARPNVLFIAIDDLNDWVGCLQGHPQAATPNIDALASRGVLFENAHCVAPACNPSRAAVFSGRLPKVTGVWSNQSGSLDRLYPGAQLLPEAFSAAGYRSLGTGKLLHSGGKQRFDAYYSVQQRWSPLSKETVKYTDDELPTKGSQNPRHVVRAPNGQTIILPLNRMPSDRAPNSTSGESFDWGPFDVPDAEMGDTQITDWAIDQLESPGDTPLFLGVGYYRPHIPLWAPTRFFNRFSETPGQLPPHKSDDLADLSETAQQWALQPVTAGSHQTVVQHEQWESAVEAYLACVSYVDHEIGRLLQALDGSPDAANTIIVLWSDHGWHLGEKQHWGKWTGWERSTRVPLIIVPPKNKAERFAVGGSRRTQPVSLLDLFPTLTELCQVQPPAELDGESLVPLLREPTRATDRIVVTTFDRGNVSLRNIDWRFIRYADGSEELYDHRSDPHEWHNLAESKQHAAQKQKFQALLPKVNKVH